MKNWKTFLVAGLVVAVVGIVAAVQWNLGSVAIPSALQSVGSATAITTNVAPAIPVTQGQGLNLYIGVIAVQSSNAVAAVAGFDVTTDGTNWSTTAPLRCTNTVNGTTLAETPFQFTAAQLSNYQFIRPGYFQATTATVVEWTNLFYGNSY